MNNIDLAPYIGKKVLIQLMAPNVWIVSHHDKSGCAMPISGGQSFVTTPFIVGTIREKHYHLESGDNLVRFVVEIHDESKNKLEIRINPSAILAVTEAIPGEPEPGRVIQLVS